jgi:quinoprotein dehydrogenase-associated probable ABC transporter substrate-binding protein
LAELLADELEATIEYVWAPQNRLFLRDTLKTKRCDVVMGVPKSTDGILTTRAYYRSAYVFVTRADRRLDIRNLEDPLLQRLRIGAHVTGDNHASTPPVVAMNNRGVSVKAFPIYGEYTQSAPAVNLVRAVDAGYIDVALAWGPLAGWAAHHSTHPLRVRNMPERFDHKDKLGVEIAIGVRRGDSALRDRLQEVLEARQPDVAALLDRFYVPIVPPPTVPIARMH